LTGRYTILATLLAGAAIMTGAGCHSDRDNPKDLLNTYFTAAIRQDYAAVYPCYYDAYRAKVSKDDYVLHRKDAAVLRAYRVQSITEQGNTARARVELTFAPSQKLKRDRPYSTAVTEEMARENGEWKIKVW
jgi:hypothetical protein